MCVVCRSLPNDAVGIFHGALESRVILQRLIQGCRPFENLTAILSCGKTNCYQSTGKW